MVLNRCLLSKNSKHFHYNYYVILVRLSSSESGTTDKLFVKNGKAMYTKIKKQLTFRDFERLNANLKPFISKKYNEIYSVYGRMSGKNQVKEAQDRVLKIQDMLKEAQDRKRDIVYQLVIKRNELDQLHTDIMNCQKGEPRYLELVKRETEVTQKENEKIKLYELADTEERELFEHFKATQTLQNLSQENWQIQTENKREKSQTAKIKYGRFIVLVLLGFTGTIIVYRSSTTNEILQESMDCIKEKVDWFDLPETKPESWGEYAYRKIGGFIRYCNPYR